MTKYGWGAFCTDDFYKQYNADRLKEMNNQIDHLEDELFSRTYKGVPATPPAIKVGDKVRVCKARWAAEGYPENEQRYLKEGTVVSIRRELNRYSDRDRTLYEVYFDPLCTIIDGHVCHCASVKLLASYKEIYSHKPKDANFTYMFNKNSTPVAPETETLKDKFRNLWETAEKLRIQTEALKKYTDVMYKKMALLGTDITVTTVDESPFINPNMDVASWYPKLMATTSDPIGTVDKMEASEDGVKIYISQPPRCGKNFFEEIRKTVDKALDFKYHSLPKEAIEQLFPENTIKKPVRDYPSYLKKHPIIPDEIKTIKNGDKTMKTIDLRVKNIIHNGPCTIVFWMDNTKTIVKLKPGDTYDPHAAFCIAAAKKVYGNNSNISKIVDHFSKDVKVPETPPRELSLEELKEAADKLGYRVSRKPKKK